MSLENTIKEDVRELSWVFVLQGIVTLLFGVVALFWPGLGLITLLYTAAFFATMIGVSDLIFGFTSLKTNRTWWVSALSGVALIAIAAYLVRNPNIALTTFAILLGSIFVIRGILEVVGTALAGNMQARILTLIGGLLSIIAGIITWVYPTAGALGYVWALGVFAIIRGTLDIAAASNARREIETVIGRAK
jgi:uncharacterized membrane protein HdeD (DUF308 family)